MNLPLPGVVARDGGVSEKVPASSNGALSLSLSLSLSGHLPS